MQKFWKTYGFYDNPYDSSPLSTGEDSSLPIDKAYIQRSSGDFSNQKLTSMLNEGNCLAIEGELGIGKTSFGNYHRQQWEKQKLFTPNHEIPMYINWSVRDVLLHILGAITNKYILVYGQKKAQENPIFNKLIALNRSLYQQKIARSFENKQAPQYQHNVSYAQLMHYYQQITKQIKELGYQGIVIHFDHLEIVARYEPEKTRILLEEIAEILEISNIYYLFIGYPGFFSEIVAPVDRVHCFFKQWLYLPPLLKEEVVEAIQTRYQLLSHKKHICPANEDCIDYLYHAYQGKFYLILKTLTDTVSHLISPIPQTLNLEVMKQTLPILMEEKVRFALTEREWKMLWEMMSMDHFTAPQICQQLNMKKQNVATYLSNLARQNFIYPIGKQGKAMVYQVREDIKFIKGMPKLEDIVYQPDTMLANLSARQSAIMEQCQRQQKVNVNELSELTGIKTHNVRRELKVLVNLGYLECHGQTRNQYYNVKKEQP